MEIVMWAFARLINYATADRWERTVGQQLWNTDANIPNANIPKNSITFPVLSLGKIFML
jgi:hypothetical protein